MTKAETLQKYLPCHATYGDFDLCVDCPYNPNPDKIWEYGCARGQDKMIDDAIALLKEQETANTGRCRIFQCKKCGFGIDDIFVIDEEKYQVVPRYCPNCGRSVKWE